MKGCFPEDQLYDYVDGVLGSDACARLERHLESCQHCTATLAEMRSLLTRAAALPRSIEPERDLWQRIVQRIASDEAVVRTSFGAPDSPQRILHTGWLAAAAAALAVAALAVGLLVTEPGTATLGGGSHALTVSPGTVLLAEYRGAASRYDGAVKELIEVFDARRSELSPETVATVEENLSIIDKAIIEARAALEKDASDPLAGRMYASMYQRKLDLLRLVGKLPSEI